MPCSLIKVWKHFIGTCCLNDQGKWLPDTVFSRYTNPASYVFRYLPSAILGLELSSIYITLFIPASTVSWNYRFPTFTAVNNGPNSISRINFPASIDWEKKFWSEIFIWEPCCITARLVTVDPYLCKKKNWSEMCMWEPCCIRAPLVAVDPYLCVTFS
jgi:hypothetical protein